MSAKFDVAMSLGFRYTMTNEVIELEERRRIVWQPRPVARLARSFGGRIWRYELDPVQGGTRMCVTWDISQRTMGVALSWPARCRRTGLQVSLTAPVGECTFFDPYGGYTVGLEAVRDRYRRGASQVDRGSYDFEPIAMGAQGALGYVCGIQHSSIWLRGRPDPRVLDLRVTEVYGRADDRWVVLHRHADQLPS